MKFFNLFVRFFTFCQVKTHNLYKSLTLLWVVRKIVFCPKTSFFFLNADLMYDSTWNKIFLNRFVSMLPLLFSSPFLPVFYNLKTLKSLCTWPLPVSLWARCAHTKHGMYLLCGVFTVLEVLMRWFLHFWMLPDTQLSTSNVNKMATFWQSLGSASSSP